MKDQGMSAQWWDDAERDPVHVAAADWVTRLQDSEVSIEDTLAWQRWINEDARHAEAFARVEEVAEGLRLLKRPALPSSFRIRRDEYDASVPIGEWKDPRRWDTLAIAASLVVAVSGVLGWAALSSASLPWGGAGATVFQTVVGENRTVSLADGSKVTLGGNTKVEVVLGEKTRLIELARGEAFFTVAKDAVRPFKVHAGDATVVAVGTEFNVRRGGDRVVVAVTQGRVVVEPYSRIVPIALLREFKPKLVPVRVSAGEQTTAGDAGIEAAEVSPDPASATAWQTGRLAFRLEPLRYALEDVNRYARKPIVIEDSSIGDLKITGTVVDGNVEGWISSLESAFGLEAVDEPGRIVLRKK